MDDTLRRQAGSTVERAGLGFALVEQRRWQGVLDLWDPWEQGAAYLPDLGRLQVLVARVHLAVEESARHVGAALDALDHVLEPSRTGGSVDDAEVLATVLRPAAVALAVHWADELWDPESLPAAAGWTTAAVADLLARARALDPDAPVSPAGA